MKLNGSSRGFSQEFLHKIHKLVYTIDKMADRILRKTLNITFSQFLVLMAVVKHRATSQSKVAQFLNLTEAAVSRQVAFLLEKRLLTLEKNRVNKKENTLTATPLGNKKLKDSFVFLAKSFGPFVSAVQKERRNVMLEELDNILKTVNQEN